MLVGIDLRITHFARTGFHRYARGLLWSLGQIAPGDRQGLDVRLLRHPEDRDSSLSAGAGSDVAISTPLFSEDEGPRLGRELAGLGLDAVHFPFSLFPGRPAPLVLLTVHDLTCVVRPDSMDEEYLQHYRSALESAAIADLVLADSNHVRLELIERGLRPECVVACPPITPFEAEEEYFAPKDAAPSEGPDVPTDLPFLLAVGSMEPRKNLLGVLRAFTVVRRDSEIRSRLVICGGHGWKEDEFYRKLADHPYRDDIVVVRTLGDVALRQMLRACSVFVNLSVYEGFGLPVLEALFEGACVVSSPVPSLVECGFPSSGLVSPTEPDAAGRTLATLIEDSDARSRLAKQGREAAAGYYRSLDPARHAKLLVQP